MVCVVYPYVFNFNLSCFFLGPAIGFISYPKFVKEGTNEVIIEFGIISGRLQTNISVNINAFSRRKMIMQHCI